MGTAIAATKKKPRGKPFAKGQSGNPNGAPKRGESWAEIIKQIGDMTPKEAADMCRAVAGKLATIGDGVTLKQAVVLRVFAALMFDPQPGLLNAFMERAEGKVKDVLSGDDEHPIKQVIEIVYTDTAATSGAASGAIDDQD